MSELRRFRATDLFTFNPINLDRLTETYNLSFYLSYMATWPDLFLVQHAPGSTTVSGSTTGGLSSGSTTVGSTNGGLSSHEAPAAHEPTAAGRMMGYLMGKLEGRGTDWHSHVTAITVSPEYRRLGVARGMMQGFELSSDQYGPQPETSPCKRYIYIYVCVCVCV
jgi:N-terminal acetyltransferase B complex catalytic subunit